MELGFKKLAPSLSCQIQKAVLLLNSMTIAVDFFRIQY